MPFYRLNADGTETPVEGNPFEGQSAGPSITTRASEPTAGVSPLYDIMRSAGTGLRRGAEGLVGLPEDVAHGMRWAASKTGLVPGGDDYVAGKNLTRGPETQEVNKASDEAIGPGYEPQTTAGEYAKTVGEFVPGSVLMPGGSLARSVVGGGIVPGLASEAAGQATEGTDAEPWARAAGGLGGGVAGGLLLAPRQALTRQQGRRQDVIEAGNRQGVELPSYMMPDSSGGRTIASRMAEIPLVGAPVKRASEDAARAMGGRVDELANQIGNPDMAAASYRAADTLRAYQKRTVPGQTGRAYDDVDNAITRPDIETPLQHTRISVREMLGEQNLSTIADNDPAIRLVWEAINRPGMTYAGLKELRTAIGARMSGKIVAEPGTNKPALKRLYGALTQDLETAVQRAGGPAAYQRWQYANSLTRALKEIGQDVSKVIGVKGDAQPAELMKRVISLASATDDSARNRLNMLHIAVDETDPVTWQDMGASILGQLGRDPKLGDDVFSPKTFLNGYSKMSPQGRQILFGNDVSEALDDLATLSRSHVDLSRSSPFGATGVVSGLGLTAGAVTNPLATLASAVSANVLARLLSRPASAQKIVSWARMRNAGARSTPNAGRELSQSLAEDIAAETGEEPADILDNLMGK